MKTAERRDEYLEFSFMGIPMAFGVIEKEAGKYVPTLAVWAGEKDDGAQIAFEMMAKRVPKKAYRSGSDAKDVLNDILVHERRAVIGNWKEGEVSSTVKCKRCGKQVQRKETICVRDRTSLAFACIEQCVKQDKELF